MFLENCIAKAHELAAEFKLFEDSLSAIDLLPNSEKTRDVDSALASLAQLRDDLRKILAVATWNRHIDNYNPWQVFTEGHDFEIRLDDRYMELEIESSLFRVRMPEGVTILPGTKIVFLSPQLTTSGPKDTIRITISAQIDFEGATFTGTFEIDAGVSFTATKAGSLIPLRMIRLSFAEIPNTIKEELTREVESSLTGIRLLGRDLVSQLAGVNLVSSQLNEDFCIFGRRANVIHDIPIGGPMHGGPQLGIPINHEALPVWGSIAVRIPATPTWRALYAENGGSIHEKGYTRNPYDGANKAYEFGVKYEIDIEATVDLGCLGKYTFRYRALIWVYFLLTFLTRITSNGTAELISAVRRSDNGQVVGEEVIRQIPSAKQAFVTVSNTGAVQFVVERK